MAWNLVQSAEGTSTSATTNCEFSVAPTSGNLVILCFASDDYNGTPNTGWTQSSEMEQQTFHGGYLWWQVSDGNQPPDYTIGSAANSSWVLLEFEWDSGTWAYDDSQGQLQQTSTSSYTTPTITPETTETNGSLLVAMLGGSTSSSVDLSGDLTSWANSFTHIRSSGPASASGTRDIVGSAYRIVTGDASTGFSTGANYPQTMQSKSGLIISFTGTTVGGGPDDLVAESGSHTVSGTAANLEFGRAVDAASGSYAVSGTEATLSRGLPIDAEAGSYTVSGTAAALEHGREVAAEAGSYTVSGTAANLEHNKEVAAESGSYTVSGTDASLEYGYAVDAESGSYTVAGQDATLLAGSETVLAAEAGSYAVSGTQASLEHGYEVSAAAGSYEVTGNVVTLRTSQDAAAQVQPTGGWGTKKKKATYRPGELDFLGPRIRPKMRPKKLKKLAEAVEQQAEEVAASLPEDTSVPSVPAFDYARAERDREFYKESVRDLLKLNQEIAELEQAIIQYQIEQDDLEVLLLAVA